MEHVLVLRLRTPEMLKELRASRAARYLGDPLGPTVVIVKAGAWEKVIGALAELGYLQKEILETGLLRLNKRMFGRRVFVDELCGFAADFNNKRIIL